MRDLAAFARPLVLVSLALPLLHACGGGSGGGGGGSRADIVASIPEPCRFLADDAFGLSDQELVEVRDAGCFAPSGDFIPAGDGTPAVPESTADASLDTSPDDIGAVEASGDGGQIVVAPTEGDIGPADVEGSSFLITGNNSARLTGERFGQGTSANAALRRSVPVRLATPSNDFEIEAAHVIGSGSSFDVVIVVTNRANATLCGISLGSVGVLDSAGGETFEGSEFFGIVVEGSAARTPAGRLETQCLAPGESSYAIVLSPEDLEAGDVVAIAVTAITHDDAPVTSAMSRLVPTGYTIAGDRGGLDVTIRNEGLVDVEAGYGVLIVLDENGYPLDFTNDFSQDIVPAGGEIVVPFNGLSVFSGQADTIRVIVGYFDPL